MEIYTVTAFALVTLTDVSFDAMLPPSVLNLIKLLNFTEPLIPSLSPDIPDNTNSLLPFVAMVDFCGLNIDAVKVRLPGLLAVRRTTITWSGFDDNTCLL